MDSIAHIESILRLKIESGEMETGLYKIGSSFVVVDQVGVGIQNEITFQWFREMHDLSNLLN